MSKMPWKIPEFNSYFTLNLSKLKVVIRKNPFETIFFACLFIYSFVLRGTPSSFGIVYQILGLPSPNLFGYSQPIRSDEWNRWTPKLINYMQQDRNTFNLLSPAREEFGNISPLPANNFRIFFQPYHWGYIYFDSSWALAIYWFLLFAVFAVFARALLLKFGVSRVWSNLGVFLFFFNPYIQTWLTVLGISLLIFPLLTYLILDSRASRALWLLRIYVFVVFTQTSPYLLDIPIFFISFAVFLFVQLIRAQISLSASLRNITLALIGTCIGIALNLPQINAIQSTVYPGERWAINGNVPIGQWLSQFYSSFGYSGWDHLFNGNTCEAAAGASILPGLVFGVLLLNLVISPSSIRKSFPKKEYRSEFFATITLIVFFALLSLWQLVPLPEFVGKILLIGHATANRTLGISGFVLLLISLRILTTHKLLEKISPLKLLTVLVLLTSASLLITDFRTSLIPDHSSFAGRLLALDDYIPLVTVFSIGIIILISKYFEANKKDPRIFTKKNTSSVLLITSSAVTAFAIWGTFNPILSSDKIFELKNTDSARNVSAYILKDSRPIIFPPSGPIGWLQALGIPTPINSYDIPPLEYWKVVLGSKFEEVRDILNRSSYLEVVYGSKFGVGAADVVHAPVSVFDENEYQVAIFHISNQSTSADLENQMVSFWCNDESTAVLDSYSLDNVSSNSLINMSISGWLNFETIDPINVSVKQIGNREVSISYANRKFRPDVLKEVGLAESLSGFDIGVNNLAVGKCIRVYFTPEVYSGDKKNS
jgi:hypothetical protein